MNGHATPVAQLLNLGPASARMLAQVGVLTREDLARVGAVEAWRLCRGAGWNPSLTLVYAIEGALLQCPWNRLPEGRRQELRAAVAALRKGPRP